MNNNNDDLDLEISMNLINSVLDSEDESMDFKKYLIVEIYKEIRFRNEDNTVSHLNKFKLMDEQCNLIDVLAYDESYEKFPRNLQLYDVKRLFFNIFL